MFFDEELLFSYSFHNVFLIHRIRFFTICSSSYQTVGCKMLVFLVASPSTRLDTYNSNSKYTSPRSYNEWWTMDDNIYTRILSAEHYLWEPLIHFLDPTNSTSYSLGNINLHRNYVLVWMSVVNWTSIVYRCARIISEYLCYLGLRWI